MVPSNSLSLHSSLPLPSPNLIRYPNANYIPNPNFPLSQARGGGRLRCRRGGWDPNAESVRTGRFSFRDEGEEEEEKDYRRGRSGGGWRRWWSGESDDEFYDEFVDEENGEDFWDKVWIFKVFKAYGYTLPIIIASMLLATGPKAFLMALALPLGQSAISIAFEKLWGRTAEEPRMRAKSKRKPFGRASSNFRRREKEGRNSDYRGRNDYRSWVSADPLADDKASASRRSSFGGWDDLDNQKGPMRRKSPSAEPLKKEKLSKGGRYRDVPLFMRLLIAVFPFLGSWTRIL